MLLILTTNMITIHEFIIQRHFLSKVIPYDSWLILRILSFLHWLLFFDNLILKILKIFSYYSITVSFHEFPYNYDIQNLIYDI